MNPSDSPFRIPLVREIALILLLKLAAIVVIKWLFFSQPVDLNHAENSIEQHFGFTHSKAENCPSDHPPCRGHYD